MTKKRDVGVYLDDIKESIAKIEEYTQFVSEDDFFENSQLQDSIVRRLEIIGEAVKNLPQKFKDKYPDIPWRDIAGTRNILIHEYFGVNIERVWLVVKNDLPDLKKKLEKVEIE